MILFFIFLYNCVFSPGRFFTAPGELFAGVHVTGELFIAAKFATILGADESNNLSNSTLRRKLFEGILDDDYDQPNDEVDTNPRIHNIGNEDKTSDVKVIESPQKYDGEDEVGSARVLKQYSENFSNSTNHERNTNKENQHPIHDIHITPGAIMLTPTAKSVGPTPDRSVSIVCTSGCRGVKISPRNFL